LNKDTVVEFRYQGNRSWGAWSQEDWNTLNVYETSWMNGRDGFGVQSGEYEKRETTARERSAAGRRTASSTRDSGTSPLPVILAHLNARTMHPIRPRTSATSGRAPRSCRCSTHTPGSTHLRKPPVPELGQRREPGARRATRGISTTRWRWVPPELLGAESGAANRERVHQQRQPADEPLRDRPGSPSARAGLAAQASYTWSRSFSGSLQDYHLDRFYLRNTGIPHAIQGLFSYDMPFGRGKRYGANMNAVAGRIAGGWTFSGTVRFQTQSFVLRNALMVGYDTRRSEEGTEQDSFRDRPHQRGCDRLQFP
jgi:hypothetical protein